APRHRDLPGAGAGRSRPGARARRGRGRGRGPRRGRAWRGHAADVAVTVLDGPGAAGLGTRAHRLFLPLLPPGVTPQRPARVLRLVEGTPCRSSAGTTSSR